MASASSQNVPRSLQRSVSWATIGRASNALLGFALILLAARLLAPADLGAWLMFLFAAGPIALFGQFGLPPLLARMAASHREASRQRGYAEVDLSIPAGLLISMATLLLLVLMHLLGMGQLLQRTLGAEDGLGLLASPLFPMFFCTQALALVSAEALKAKGQIRDASITALIVAPATTLVLSIALTIPLISEGSAVHPELFIRAACIGYGLAAGIALSRLWQAQWVGQLTATLRLAKDMLPMAAPILATALFAFGCAQLDMLFATQLFDAEEIALYGLALRTLQLLLLPLQVANSFAAPYLADLQHQPKTELARFCQQVSAACLILGIAAGFVILAAFPWLAEGNASVAPHIVVLVPAILIAGQLVNCATSLAAMNLEIAGRARSVLRNNAVAAGVGALGFVLIGAEAGLLGFAAVSAGMRLLQNLLMAHSNQRRMGIRVTASWAGITELFTWMLSLRKGRAVRANGQ